MKKKTKKVIRFPKNYIELLIEEIVKNERVMLSGFGVFELRNTKARRHFNPIAKKFITLEPFNRLRFRPLLRVRRKINE